MNAPRTALGLGLATLALAAPAAAQAAPINDSHVVNVAAQTQDIGSYGIHGDTYLVMGWATYHLDVTSRATWTGSLSTVTSWNSTNVRQGATLPVGRVSPLQNGNLRVVWTVRGDVNADLVDYAVDRTITVDASCTPSLLGSTYDCKAASPSITMLRSAFVPNGPYINLKLHAKFTVTPEGAIVSRSLTTAGMAPVTKSGLGLSPAPAIDNVAVPCAQAGSPVAYKLGPVHWTPAVSVTQQPRVEVGMMDSLLGQVEMPAFKVEPVGPPIKTKPAFDLTASGHTTALGTLLPNNVAPTIAPMTFSQRAGVAGHLSADVTSRCDIASSVWKFADGSVAYGESPAKTFSKPGTVTGQLKVTDTSGLSATRDFSVNVSA